MSMSTQQHMEAWLTSTVREDDQDEAREIMTLWLANHDAEEVEYALAQGWRKVWSLAKGWK